MVAVQLAFSGENKQKSYEAARQQALDVADVFSASPVQIRATFHLHVLAGQLDGSYEYDRISKDEYREEFKAPGISELFIFKGGQGYSVRSRELEPLPVFYLRELIYSARLIPSNVPISKVTTAVQNGDNVKCYLMEGSQLTGDYSAYAACFASANGALVSRDWRFNTELHRFEYSNFLHDGKNIFPGTMLRFQNRKLLVEVKVESVAHVPIDEKLFEPPPNATKQEVCRKFDPAEADYTNEYFRLRSDFKSGTVIIAGSLDDHGKMRETEIQQSADPKVDELALRALKEVRVRPAKCDGHAIPSFFRLQIWFSPALHPDSFESFR